MKNFIKLFIIGVFLVSCEKEDLAHYKTIEEPTNDSGNWSDNYSNGGVIPTGNGFTNQLSGSRWVLTRVVSAFATTYPNDTIEFVSNNRYVLNQNAQRPYTLTLIQGSNLQSLTLNFFTPFGGSNYAGQISPYAYDDGELNNIEFTDLQNNTSKIRAWFEKID